jgi:Prokaryotic E2 family E/Multiubiquitin
MTTKQETYRVQIDERIYAFNDPVITGQQILNAVGERPADEYLVFQVLQGGQLEEIRLDETIDLQKPGIERFITFKSDRSFRLVIDGRRFEWGKPMVSGEELKKLAGVDPISYGVWQEIAGADDRPILDNELVDLQQPGVERFFTGKKTTTEGNCFLPAQDRQYLVGGGLQFEEVVDGPSNGLIIRGFLLPSGRYDATQADLLILLPFGYSDTPPDMFYLLPWIRLAQVAKYPNAADQPFIFKGQQWQRWSRHNNEWRPGIDGIWTMLKRVEYALEIAV